MHAKILEATYANDEEEVVRIEKELKTIRPREAELKAIEDKLNHCGELRYMLRASFERPPVYPPCPTHTYMSAPLPLREEGAKESWTMPKAGKKRKRTTTTIEAPRNHATTPHGRKAGN